MDKHTEQPQAKAGFLPILAALGGFFLFLAIVAFIWLDRMPSTVAHSGVPAEERVRILSEQREREQEILNQYGWVDRGAGVVRLPIERAMDVWVEEMNQGAAQN